MGAIEEYRARRDARLEEIKNERIDAFKARRNERLRARGILPVEYRADAPDDKEENNNQNSEGESSGGHGNTRLPFGLCKRYGIEIDPSWTPRDAWAALAEKGITPEGAFDKLKKGEDPGTPESPEPPKEPVKKITESRYGGAEYNKLVGRLSRWVSRGSDPWRLSGDKVDGTGDGSWAPSRMSVSFRTKTDMLRWLKEKGVEEFEDPETGEVLNPSEMELPEPKIVVDRAGYTDLAIGMRDGRYTVTAKDMDGKSKKLGDFGSLSRAKELLARFGVKEEDVKLSPALKKREKERLAWLTSDKKEYFEGEDGTRYGDITLSRGTYGEWEVVGESEEGRKLSKEFGTKAEAMKFLKEQGVQKIKEGKEFTDPGEYKVPDTVATVSGRDYQEIGIAWTHGGEMQAYGIDLDGDRRVFSYKYGTETYDQFLDRVKRRYGFEEDKLKISDDTKAQIEKIKKEEAEREQRKKEFEAKAIPFYGGMYADVELVKDPDTGWFSFYGYSSDGIRRRITSYGDMYDMRMYAQKYGQDLSNLIKDDGVRKDYDRYMDSIKEFEAKATEIAGEKYADISISYFGGRFRVRGYDERGREKEIAREGSYEDLEKVLNQYGLSPTSFPMDERAEKKKDKAIKAKYGIATGEYYSLGKKDNAYKDIEFSYDNDSGLFKMEATDVDGERSTIDWNLTWDAVVSKMSDYGVSDYKLKGKDGKEMGKPKWGMHKVMLMRKPEGGYLVYADSPRYGKHAVMYETPKEEEARRWLRDNNVPEEGIKTRGMNPNDDVVRKHTAKTLEKFDAHRAEAIEGSFIDDLSEDEKKETVDMLTDVFKQGAIRAVRSPRSFGGIIDDEYKSQVELGTGGRGAFISKSARKSVSDKMYGHGGLQDNEYEKCGYLGYADEAEDYDDSAHPFYGEMTYTFRKDRMEDKMTYTFGDSLNTERTMSCAGYGGSKPTIEGMTSLYGADYLRNALAEYRKYKKGEITYSEMFRRIRRDANNRYIELQFHGPVTVEDIEKVSFRNEDDLKKAFERMSAAKRKRVIKKLKDNSVGLLYRTGGGPFKDAWPWVEEHYKDDMPV